MADKTQDLNLQQGKTKPQVIRCEVGPVIYKPITAVSLTSGAPRITVPSHGVPDGWRIACSRVGGMRQLNAKNTPPRDSDYRVATVIDANTIELNSVVPVDSNEREWPAYTSGGFLQYNTPRSLAGYAGRMDIRTGKGKSTLLICTNAGTSGTSRPTAGTDGTVVWAATTQPYTVLWEPNTAYAVGDVVDAAILFSMTTANKLIVIDDTAKAVTLYFDALDFTALSWKRGYYELELYKTVVRDGVSIVEVYSPTEGVIYLDAETTK